jgi:ribonucleoside-triphosphate reductase (formate)
MGEKNKIINTPIDSDLYKKYERAYQYAMDMTKKECHQAIEGMYHNLR